MEDFNKTDKLPAKFRKKLSRARAKLFKEGFELSESPTPYLVISNAGTANGVRRKDLELLIDNYESIVMSPSKSYAMVSFDDAVTAAKIIGKLQGHVLTSEDNLASATTTLYLHYSKSFPRCEDTKEFTSMDYRDVPGLIIMEDFISKEEEERLLQFLKDENPVAMGNDKTENQLKHRRVWHYGYEFRYKYNDADPNKPLENGIPEMLQTQISKIINVGYIKNQPNQITVNKYEPGQGIPPHVDNPEAFHEFLASLSLGSQTVMDFKSPQNGSHVQVLLKPCSLVIFTGDARYKWTHGICPRKVDLLPDGSEDGGLTPINRGTRYSITFRRVKDDYKGPGVRQTVIDPVASQPTSELEAASLEEIHVHKVYDEIATHFTITREKPWPRVKQFIDGLGAHSLVLDVGCGSGRYLGVRNDVQMIGCDRSENLIGICKEKGFKVFISDGLDLPIRGGIFDACICIAVIHHYSTLDRRLKAIKELLKMVRNGGKILISVWALEQEYKRVKSKYLKKIGEAGQGESPTIPQNSEPDTSERHDFKQEKIAPPETLTSTDVSDNKQDEASSNCLPVHKNRTPFQQQDVLVPWHKKNAPVAKTETVKKTISPGIQTDVTQESKTFHRYYHVFKKGELVEICERFDNVKVLELYYDEGNWCVILEKL